MMSEFPQLINSHDDSVINITNASFSLGRSLSCDYTINSLGVSRFHCLIKQDANKWTLVDRSTNGTFVNSTLYKFNESVDLNDGDVIKLGPDNLDFVFRYQPQNVINEMMVEEIQEPLETLTEKKEEPPPQTHEEDSSDIMEHELTCSICSELFVKAVTLNCSHTFCKYCINEWKKKKKNCPICRKYIQTVAPTLVLDNFIEKFISKQSEEVKESRKNLLKEREEVVKASGSADGIQTIQIFSDSEMDDEELEEESSIVGSDEEDFDDYDYDDDSHYGGRSSGSRVPYYGGYGRCFVCNQTGHWANSCPFKYR